MHSSRLHLTIFLAFNLVVMPLLHAEDESKDSVTDSRSLGSEIQLTLNDNLKSICKETLGYDYPFRAIIYRRNGTLFSWQIMTKGKHGLISSEVDIKNGNVLNCRILSNNELLGKGISKRSFLKQFTGMHLQKPKTLNKRVDAISGATVSSKAVERAVSLALQLESYCINIKDKE